MAAIPPVTAARSPGGGDDDVSIRMPAAAAATAGGAVLLQPTREVDGGAPAKSKPPENHLSRFVHCVAFGEWAGNAFGALAFVWATGVLLGGFCSSLNRQDFWVATIMIFIESFRYARPPQHCFVLPAIYKILFGCSRIRINLHVLEWNLN